MKRRKVLFIVENLPVPFDTRVWREATTLNNNDYQVSVVCPSNKEYPKLFEKIDGIRIYRFPLPSLESIFGHIVEYSIAALFIPLLVFFVWIKDGFHVIHCANPPDIFFPVGAFYKIFGKKFVFDHHDLMPEICESRWVGWKKLITYNLSLGAEKLTFKVADYVVSTNQSYRNIAICRGGVDPNRVVVVRNGPRKADFIKLSPDNTLKNGKEFLVCYIGVMGPNDGIDYLLKSIDHIVNKKKIKSIQFTLIGSGDCQPRMVAEASALGLEDNILFTGRIPDLDARQLLSTADLCVAPDPMDQLNNVSTMNKIIEYMALGKALVSYDLIEARVSAGDAAYYAQPNDTEDFAEKILKLLHNPNDRNLMEKIGRERFITNLAWEHQEKNLIDLYNRIFNEG